jgi:hypothetical protein
MSRDAADGGRSCGRSAIIRRLSSTALVLPRRTSWHELTGGQRIAVVSRGVVQLGLLTAALWDLHSRPPGEIRGRKAIWVAVSAVNYLGLGPLAYFAFGRRRSSSAERGSASPSLQ